MKNLRIGIIGGVPTWDWMGFGLIIFIATRIRRNRNVIQKQFRVISNNICSRKHGSLGIGLTVLRSSCFLFSLLAQHRKSLSICKMPGNVFLHFDQVWHLWEHLFSNTCLYAPFSRHIHGKFECFTVARCLRDKRRAFLQKQRYANHGQQWKHQDDSQNQ